MQLCFVARREKSGRLEDDLDLQFFPGQISRVAFFENPNLVAAHDDVLLTWKQLVALHRQWHSLSRELKDAELALGQDNSEANYSRLLDVKARLSSLDGTEALVEGFGAQSGRPTLSF